MVKRAMRVADNKENKKIRFWYLFWHHSRVVLNHLLSNAFIVFDESRDELLFGHACL